MTEYPIIGMSPGNSYFKDEVVKELLQKVIEKYGKTVVFIADIPAISTFIALGYPENRARRDKAIPQGNNLKNRTRRAMTELGYSEDQVRIIDWEKEVQDNPDYIKKYQEVVTRYNSSSLFREAAHEATRVVLVKEEKQIDDLDTAVKIAVTYLLSEFAFMEFAPAFFNVDKVTYIYHKKWSVYESYRTGEFDGEIRDYLGAEIVLTSGDK